LLACGCYRFLPRQEPRPWRFAASLGYFCALTDMSEWHTFRHYAERNRALADLGFHTYRDYLASPMWSDLRKRVVFENVECVGCHEKATQSHHNWYCRDNLTGETLEGLEPVCRKCHEYIEFGKGHVKLTPTQAEFRLIKLKAKKAGKKPKLTQKHRLSR
jgi:hypothetical protein